MVEMLPIATAGVILFLVVMAALALHKGWLEYIAIEDRVMHRNVKRFLGKSFDDSLLTQWHNELLMTTAPRKRNQIKRAMNTRMAHLNLLQVFRQAEQRAAMRIERLTRELEEGLDREASPKAYQVLRDSYQGVGEKARKAMNDLQEALDQQTSYVSKEALMAHRRLARLGGIWRAVNLKIR